MVNSTDTGLKPPKQLNQRGESDGHITGIIEVRVCQDPTGRVWSEHLSPTPQDGLLFEKMRGQGVRQIAHALLTEALRRETFVSALAALTADEGYLQTYKDADPEERRKIEAALGEKVREVVWRTQSKMGAGCAREVLDMMVSQF